MDAVCKNCKFSSQYFKYSEIPRKVVVRRGPPWKRRDVEVDEDTGFYSEYSIRMEINASREGSVLCRRFPKSQQKYENSTCGEFVEIGK